MLTAIEKAGGSIDKAANQCMQKSAKLMDEELKAQMRSANVKSDLINRMPSPEVEKEGNRYTARVGFVKGEYNPTKPSDAYKAIFLNYGTPRRTKHGQVKARHFIENAKEKAKSKIENSQQQTFKEILGGLKK
nr:MAG TPA_asm: type I neck protein [Caudoviricetes sp.]